MFTQHSPASRKLFLQLLTICRSTCSMLGRPRSAPAIRYAVDSSACQHPIVSESTCDLQRALISGIGTDPGAEPALRGAAVLLALLPSTPSYLPHQCIRRAPTFHDVSVSLTSSSGPLLFSVLSTEPFCHVEVSLLKVKTTFCSLCRLNSGSHERRVKVRTLAPFSFPGLSF